MTKNGKVVCKVCGFSLNVRGKKQLNYTVMKNNILDEILNPLEQRQNTTVVDPCHFVVGVKTNKIHKKDGDNFKLYPNGYSQLDDQNI